MKNTLALVMVLSMAGLASAGLQIEVSGGKAMVTGQLDQDMYLILAAGNGATLSNFALGAGAPLASIGERQGTAADFAAVGVPVPDGFTGEGWWLASFPGEAYKTGTQLQADLAVTTTQETRTWEEMVAGCWWWPGGWIIRTWTEITEIQKGSLSLDFLALNPKTGDIDQMGSLDDMSLDRRTVISLTFMDGMCPEPATLALLGL